jgi:parallel beta-helix repeat protein
MKTSIIVLISLFFLTSISASTYFVSNSGDDNANGSESTPWETLQYAAGQVQAGDSVIVLAGEYAGFVMGWDDEVGGSAENPVVFKANQGATIVSDNIHTEDGINLEGIDYIVIDGFTITNTDGFISRAGIRSVENTGIVIRNNTIDGMGTWGIFTGFSDNILIENNRCSNSIEQHGIYFSNSGDNPIIRGNICYSNNGCGIHMNGDISMGGDGIISNALVEANIIYDNGDAGGSAINCDGVQNSTFRNNLLYNNHAGGISLFQIDGAEPAYNNKVINNTIVMPADGRWAINIANGSSGNTVLNNILFSGHSFRGGLVIDEEGLTGFTSDYNVSIDRFSPDGDATILTLEAWQAETGQDEHSVVSSSEATFIDANNYHLITGCYAIDHGTPTNAPSNDLEGRVRPWGSGYDIGAYEFGAPVYFQGIIENQEIQVFPNPLKEECFVQSNGPISRIEIIDMEGRMLLKQEGNGLPTILLNTSVLPKGIYLIRVFSQDTFYAAKIVRE